MGIDFALKHFEIIILVGLKSIEVFFLFGVKATHTHTFLTKIGFLIPTDQVQEANRKWEVLNVQICGFYSWEYPLMIKYGNGTFPSSRCLRNHIHASTKEGLDVIRNSNSHSI